MDTRIRAAGPADAAAIARINVATWRTTYAGIVPAEHVAGRSYSVRESRWEDKLAAASAATGNFVAETGTGAVIGFASAGPERERSPTYRGEIYAIYLLEPYQRQGIGRRLVAAVAEHLLDQGIDSLLVWVLADNPACRFYASLGGQQFDRKTITIGGTDLIELAYGWSDISSLSVIYPGL